MQAALDGGPATRRSFPENVRGPAAAIVASAVVTAPATTSELTTFFADMVIASGCIAWEAKAHHLIRLGSAHCYGLDHSKAREIDGLRGCPCRKLKSGIIDHVVRQERCAGAAADLNCGRKRRVFVQRQVRSTFIAIALVAVQQSPEMAFAEDDHMVEALTSVEGTQIESSCSQPPPDGWGFIREVPSALSGQRHTGDLAAGLKQNAMTTAHIKAVTEARLNAPHRRAASVALTCGLNSAEIGQPQR
jgi:hypothetical protein